MSASASFLKLHIGDNSRLFQYHATSHTGCISAWKIVGKVNEKPKSLLREGSSSISEEEQCGQVRDILLEKHLKIRVKLVETCWTQQNATEPRTRRQGQKFCPKFPHEGTCFSRCVSTFAFPIQIFCARKLCSWVNFRRVWEKHCICWV